MRRTVKVFVIPAARLPGGPPEAAQDMTVEAATLDGLREVARARLIEAGYRLRSISFAPDGLVAYVEQP